MKSNQAGLAHLQLVISLLVVAGVIGAAGVTVYTKNKPKSDTTVNSEVESQKVSTIGTLPTDLLSVDDVQTLATKVSPDATLKAVELENEEGTLVYKVKLADGSVLVFDAKSGERVTKTSISKEVEVEHENGSIPADFKPGIDLAKAREVALTRKPGGSVVKIHLESEEGKVVYSVRFSDGSRVDVNAGDGSVLRVRAAGANGTSGSNTTTTKPVESGDDKGGSTTSGSSAGSSNSGSSASGSAKSGSTSSGSSSNSGSGTSSTNGSSSSSGSGSSGSDDSNKSSDDSSGRSSNSGGSGGGGEKESGRHGGDD